MKPPELAFDRDLLSDIKTRVRHPRPAERIRFQSAKDTSHARIAANVAEQE